jgi:hypothetical protein
MLLLCDTTRNGVAGLATSANADADAALAALALAVAEPRALPK